MGFEISKFLWDLADPTHVAFLALCGGAVLLWTGWARVGKILISGTMVLLFGFAVVPAGQWLNVTLENRFPVPHPMPVDVDGIIVLGGTLDQFISKRRGQVTLGGAATRLLAIADLVMLYPRARVVFSGGSGTVGRPDVKEADYAREVFASMGLDTSRFEFEDQARNTFENAILGKEVAKPQPGEAWLLVTSARHMPRAVGTFRKAGWPVIPFPVDFRTEGPYELLPRLNFRGFDEFAAALKEWVGLAAYRMMDRTDQFLPGQSR